MTTDDHLADIVPLTLLPYDDSPTASTAAPDPLVLGVVEVGSACLLIATIPVADGEVTFTLVRPDESQLVISERTAHALVAINAATKVWP